MDDSNSDEDEGPIGRRIIVSLADSVNEFDVTEDSEEERDEKTDSRQETKERKRPIVIPIKCNGKN